MEPACPSCHAPVDRHAEACPVCRQLIPHCAYCHEAIGPEIPECPACETPYHEECWNENRGCARIGCSEAPEDADATHAATPAKGSRPAPTVAHDYRPGRRRTYRLLAVTLGWSGVHNLYAGRRVPGFIQLSLCCLSLLYAAPLVFLWSITEAAVVNVDGRGGRLL